MLPLVAAQTLVAFMRQRVADVGLGKIMYQQHVKHLPLVVFVNVGGGCRQVQTGEQPCTVGVVRHGFDAVVHVAHEPSLAQRELDLEHLFDNAAGPKALLSEDATHHLHIAL